MDGYRQYAIESEGGARACTSYGVANGENELFWEDVRFWLCCSSGGARAFTPIDFHHPLRRSTFILAGWMILLAGGIAWAGPCSYHPCPEQIGYWRAAGWYQAGRGAPGNDGRYNGVPVRPFRSQPDQEHLGQWLRQHQNMSFAAQERALRTEPGFNRLPPATQQRLLDRLQQLDAMPPAQRARRLQRLRTWERLSPEQRQQVRIRISK